MLIPILVTIIIVISVYPIMLHFLSQDDIDDAITHKFKKNERNRY